MFSDFVTIATDQIVNQAAKMRYMFGRQGKGADGAENAGRLRHRSRGAAQPEPGGLVLSYSGAQSGGALHVTNAKGLLKAAIGTTTRDILRAEASLPENGLCARGGIYHPWASRT
jgi:pyruvate dehydrogenase E1 component beta subunit